MLTQVKVLAAATLITLSSAASAQAAGQVFDLPSYNGLAVALNAALPAAGGQGFAELVKKGVLTDATDGQVWLVTCTSTVAAGRAPGSTRITLTGCKVESVDAAPADVAPVSLQSLFQSAAKH